ncbi:hypothetical protein T265_03961 [Opisthorchis viverrini]|uniref:Reverse transcriptase domain-containing protein n=1 Tax=Opisthorchis viverrini TaxID=6198 RepID=A0A074ZQI7_OPIVI|nr:hypothetical protein T265_03961 [Opisthorchis viverrini]KER29391.1 hypothetical protein T265_03961 [Opisthorchis viverrini]
MSIDVDALLSRLSPTMSSSTKAELGSVLSEYTDVFAWKDSDVGRTKQVQHCADTGDATPIRLPPRRVPIQYQHQLNQMIDDMLSKDIIKPSAEPDTPLNPHVFRGSENKPLNLRSCASVWTVGESY